MHDMILKDVPVHWQGEMQLLEVTSYIIFKKHGILDIPSCHFIPKKEKSRARS